MPTAGVSSEELQVEEHCTAGSGKTKPGRSKSSVPSAELCSEWEFAGDKAKQDGSCSGVRHYSRGCFKEKRPQGWGMDILKDDSRGGRRDVVGVELQKGRGRAFYTLGQTEPSQKLELRLANGWSK